MPHDGEYSLGIDLGQSPWAIALAHGDVVELLTPQTDITSIADHLLERGGVGLH